MKYDFRADTVTKPDAAMMEAMMKAEVGDDCFGDDPTVIQLETRIASMCGMEAALFVVSGVMSNQLAMRVHLSEPMLSVIGDRRSHIYQNENGGLAYHSGGTFIPLDPLPGTLHITAEQCKNAIQKGTLYNATTHMITLENTLGGIVFPIEEIKKIRNIASENDLKMHLDGARLWNACIRTALGAPIGSVLVGSKEFIQKAKKYRKLFGGGWRQAGILAACGIYALDNNIARLHEDHENATYFAQQLVEMGFSISIPVDTNMVFVNLAPKNTQILAQKLKNIGIIISDDGPGDTRFVIHLQTPREAIDLILKTLKSI